MDAKVILDIPYGFFFNKTNNQGYCFVCDKALTSTQQKNEHINGRKHRNEMIKFGFEGGISCGQEEMKRCSICKVILLGESSVKQHLASAKHRDHVRVGEEEELSRAVTMPTNGLSGVSAAGANAVGHLPAVAMFPSGVSPDLYSQGPLPALAPAHVCMEEGAGVSREMFKKILRQDVELNDLDDTRSSSTHVTGVNILSSDASEMDHVPQRVTCEASKNPLSCNICFTRFTGTKSAAEHFSSDHHKKKANIAKLVASGETLTDPDTGALKLEHERNSWFICKVCMCRLDTKKQYRQHVESPQHKEVLKRSIQNHEDQSLAVDLPATADVNPLATKMSTGLSIHSFELEPLAINTMVKMTSPSAPEVSSTHVGTTGLQDTESEMRTWRKFDSGVSDSYGLQNHTTEPRNGLSMMTVENSRNTGKVFPSLGWVPANDPSPEGLQGGKTNEPFHPCSVTSMSSAFQMGTSTDRESSGCLGQNHPQSVIDGGISFDMPRNKAVYQRAESGRNGCGSRLVGSGVLLDDDNYETDDTDYLSLPRFCSTAQDRKQANYSFEESEEEKSFPVSDSEEAMLSQAGSSMNTTSSSETSAHTQPANFPIMRELNAGTEAALIQKEQTKTHSTLERFCYKCYLCKKGMNTRKDLEIHNQGFQHMKNSATVLAPDRSTEPLVNTKFEDRDAVVREMYSLGRARARSYQVELFCNIMASDSTVVFLPTGTGKTLVAMMTIRRMLMLNKTRPVLFLTDKVLLMIQQARNIKEMGEDIFLRPHLTEEGKMEKRQLKVAKLCGNVAVSEATPLWKYDVIVITAVCCHNLMQKGVLRWDSFSLVVLDEVHHCAKDHPYKTLMDVYHLSIPSSAWKPKVLGLTASPAGKATKEATLVMLNTLLHNLGGAKIAAIGAWSSDHVQEELASFSSNAQLVMEYIPMNKMEKEFQTRLCLYLAHAYQLLKLFSNLQDICNGENVNAFSPEELDGIDKLLHLVQSDGLQACKPKSDEDFRVIKTHVTDVGNALLNSEEGFEFVLEDLEHIFNTSQNRDFSALVDMGLPCMDIAEYITNLCESVKLRASEEASSSVEAATMHMSVFQKLLETLGNRKYIHWQNPESMALVLVQERKLVYKFKDHLEKSYFVRDARIQVEVLVGHGLGSGEAGGMNLCQQGKVLHKIQSPKYVRKIVVATSVAEEGIDIPSCQLVVCLNAPTTVKAMVQMRGCARKKGSYFVVLCSSEKEKEKMKDLQLHEENMIWAVGELFWQI